jgi:iron uptake system component EfeO
VFGRKFPLLLVPVVVLAAACSDDDDTSTDAEKTSTDSQTIEVTLTDAGCEPQEIETTAGPHTFEVTNEGSAAVTEWEVLEGDRILGEVENIIPGNTRSFSLTLEEGSYKSYCPGGSDNEGGTLKVTKGESAESADKVGSEQAVTDYLSYVKAESDQLVTDVQPFAAAVKGGDLAKAKELFAGAREHYETIEPIAESFGDLDPAIDAREGDVPAAEWSGFHRIEKALWVDKKADGMAPVADQLVADVKDLQAKIATVELEPAQIANGAVELLNEMSTSKITGEEDRYSHTDLSDFAANLAGSKAAFDAVQGLLGSDAEADLRDDIIQRFADVQTELDKFKGDDPTGNGYALYDKLTESDTRTVSTTLDALAEPLSQLASKVI